MFAAFHAWNEPRSRTSIAALLSPRCTGKKFRIPNARLLFLFLTMFDLVDARYGHAQGRGDWPLGHAAQKKIEFHVNAQRNSIRRLLGPRVEPPGNKKPRTQPSTQTRTHVAPSIGCALCQDTRRDHACTRHMKSQHENANTRRRPFGASQPRRTR